MKGWHQGLFNMKIRIWQPGQITNRIISVHFSFFFFLFFSTPGTVFFFFFAIWTIFLNLGHWLNDFKKLKTKKVVLFCHSDATVPNLSKHEIAIRARFLCDYCSPSTYLLHLPHVPTDRALLFFLADGGTKVCLCVTDGSCWKRFRENAYNSILYMIFS